MGELLKELPDLGPDDQQKTLGTVANLEALMKSGNVRIARDVPAPNGTYAYLRRLPHTFYSPDQRISVEVKPDINPETGEVDDSTMHLCIHKETAGPGVGVTFNAWVTREDQAPRVKTALNRIIRSILSCSSRTSGRKNYR